MPGVTLATVPQARVRPSSATPSSLPRPPSPLCHAPAAPPAPSPRRFSQSQPATSLLASASPSASASAEPGAVRASHERVLITAKQRQQIAVQIHCFRFVLLQQAQPPIVKKAFKALMPSHAKEHRSHGEGLMACSHISAAIPCLHSYLSQVLSSQFVPPAPDIRLVLSERDSFIDWTVKQRLESCRGREGLKERMMHAKLNLLPLQRRVRRKVGSTLSLDEIEGGFYRHEKTVEHQLRLRERDNRRQQAEDAKLERRQRKKFLNAVIAHSLSFSKWHREQSRLAKRLSLAAARFCSDQQQSKLSLERTAERSRMKALRDHDEAEYLRLVKEAKNERLLLILQETSRYMRSLGVQIAKEREEAGESANGEQPLVDDRIPEGMSSSHVYYSLTHRIKENIVSQPKLLTGGDLRSYQMAGLNWLVSLHNNNLSGILADEMGLGKTIQTIALLAFLIESRDVKGPFLIVAPTSTLWNNWASEFQRWLPSIKTIVYDGDKDNRRHIRQHQMLSGDFSVLLTTYDFVMRDKRWLQGIEWQMLVVDEAHRLKNSQCKLATVIGTHYRSKFRLALTGTPLQNRLPELWSLLNFLHPHVFSACSDFERWFSAPLTAITTDGDDVGWTLTDEEQLLIIDRLHSVLRPFMLRRVKSEVEKDLPDKVEKLLRCDLSSLQRFMYKSIVDKEVLVHNRVMQLRKVCNHPYLFHPFLRKVSRFPPEMSDDALVRSCGKLDMLDRILPKLKAAGHRVLIFFQMTRMMDVAESYMKWRNFEFLRLDGATSAEFRRERLNMFNDPDSPYFCFMLSTRAGGVGLNLQSADTVIIYDSDWNPQNDMQAQARAHRIGQKNQVLVIRFVTAGTIEERVMERALDKLDAEAMVIQAGMFHHKYEKETSRQMVADILRDSADENAASDIPDDDEVSIAIARSQQELELFRRMDSSRGADNRSSTSELPGWIVSWWEECARRPFERSRRLQGSDDVAELEVHSPSPVPGEDDISSTAPADLVQESLRLTLPSTRVSDITVSVKMDGMLIHEGLPASLRSRDSRRRRHSSEDRTESLSLPPKNPRLIIK